MSVGTELDQLLEELRSADKLLLTTHENPDGDALGSLVAMHGVLTQLGKDALMYMSPDEFPLPIEYREMKFEGLLGAPPADISERVVVFLDCGNIDRMPVDFLKHEGTHILNIDHHHDNTRFGTVNLVVSDASCTAEIVYDVARELGARITPEIADAMYVGLVTDTGRFMYQNTTPAAHRMAAELIEAGVDTHDVYRRLYEDLPLRRLELLQRALASVERFDDGAITMAFGFIAILNSYIGIRQELKAKETLESLALLVAPRAKAIRDGQVVEVRADEVVPGDWVRLEPGDQLVADGEVAESRGLTIDESLLTGEADGIRKKPGQRALSGSFVISGSGYYEVDAVREDSYAEKVAGEARAFRHPPSPLQEEVNEVILYSTYLMIPLAILLILALALAGHRARRGRADRDGRA